MIERHEELFTKYYAAEINNIQMTLFIGPSTTPDLKEMGLRLALCTQVGDDANQLRTELSKMLFLYALPEHEAMTSQQLASAVTGLLHLPHALSSHYVTEIIMQWEPEQLISFDGNAISLTDKGREALTYVPEKATMKLLEGRTAIREAIRHLSGYELADQQFNKLWDIFQDGIAELFYNHGLSLIGMVRSVLTGEKTTSSYGDIYPHLQKLAESSVSNFSSVEQASDVKQAIIDIFSEKDSRAFEWLTQICEIYVMMCSLGLEELSGQQIQNVLSTYHIIPDSDIIISLLCEGERNHKDIDRIIRSWVAIGGRVLLSVPVLEEVAYHAWISEYDYSHYGVNLNKLTDEDATHIIGNAFVRTFRLLAGDSTAPKHWNRYINQFRGNSEYNYERIIQVMRQEYVASILPEPSDINEKLIDEIEQFLLTLMSTYTSVPLEQIDYRIKGKIERDCRLVSSVVAERDNRKSQGDYTTSCILSSAAIFGDMVIRFQERFGPPELVLSTAAISFLLTLSPQVSMGLGTLRSVLFDTGLASRLTQAQQYSFRVITASGQWNVPWSRRGALQRTLSDVLLHEAHSRGEPIASIRDRVVSTSDPDYSAQIVAETLDKMAITPKQREDLIQARNEARKFEELYESLKSPKSSQTNKPVPAKRFKRRRK